MLRTDLAPPKRRMHPVDLVASVAVGLLLGAGSLLTDGVWPLLVGAAAIVVGLTVSPRKPKFDVVMVALLMTAGTALALGVITDPTLGGVILGLVLGSLHGLCLVVPILVAAAIDARRAYVQRGWDLAAAEAREHDAQVIQAVMRERDAMAGEIHDGLGHRLTLIAVQTGRLSLDENLPPAVRAELQTVRTNAAAAADELGETIRLFGRHDDRVPASLEGFGLADVIDRARTSGMRVTATIAPGIEASMNDYVRAALLRSLREGLTNAAKHAPDAEVTVSVDTDRDEVELRMTNDATGPGRSAPSTGHGLAALQHRVVILGGTMDIAHTSDFTITVRLPRTAYPTSSAQNPQRSRTAVVLSADDRSNRNRRGAERVAWAVPLGLLAVAALSAVGYFVYSTVASVLPAERYAAIDVGQSRADIAGRLPPLQMLDAPRTSLPPVDGKVCEYYEASVSFFYRDDVYRICFADGRVVSADTIPAP